MPGTLDELAHGIVTVLDAAPQPEPLPVELSGHTYEEALYLAQAIADECSASGAPLAMIEVGDRESFAPGGFDRDFEGGEIALTTNSAAGAALWLYRWKF